jgi:4-amino-4-deoxy-L-arabinose transferase-like glycosyltransferase
VGQAWQAWGPALVPAVVVLVGHLALSGRYGFHRDELYYVLAGRHPAFGYVDQPPFVPLAARVVEEVGGLHLWTLRAVAGTVHAALVLVAARIARELGGDRWAQATTALAVAVAPVFVAVGGMFQTVVFDLLWWALVVLLVLRLRAGADPRWWLGVGAVVGLGLQTKWSIALLGIGLAVAYAALPEGRDALRRSGPWPWLGAGLALLLWAPNLLWQAANGWPTLEFTENNNANVQAEDGGRVAFLLEQLLLPGPVAFALAVAGLVWCWRRPERRHLAVVAATVFVVLLVVGGKSYYLAPFYVPLFAAGAVAAEGAGRRWRTALPVSLVVASLVALPAVAPVLPPATYADAWFELNDEQGEQLGWPELAGQVADVYLALPDDERAAARIVTASYGEAAALEVYGPARGIPAGVVLSAHNSYADWWPDGEPTGTVVGVRYPAATFAPYCGDVEVAARIETPHDVENQIAGTPVTVCRDLRVDGDELRDALRHYE